MRKKTFRFLTAMSLALCMFTCLCSCSGQKANDLGTLKLENPSSGKDVPPLGDDKDSDDKKNPTPTETDKKPEDTPTDKPTKQPTEAPTPSPTPIEVPVSNVLKTEYFECEYFSIKKPVDWKVTYNCFDNGAETKQLWISIYDPTDKNNLILYATALEPVFTSQTEKNKMAPYLQNGDLTPVVSELSAAGLLMEWQSVAKINELQAYLVGNINMGDFQVKQILEKSVSSETENMVTSQVLASCIKPGTETAYNVLFVNSLGRLYYYTLNATYYASYGNVLIALRDDLYDENMETLVNCFADIDLSKYHQKKNGITESDDDNPAYYVPQIQLPQSLSDKE